MKTIVVIKNNSCNFDKMEDYALPLLYQPHTKSQRLILKQALNNYIWSVIEPYVSFVQVKKNDNFLPFVCNQLKDYFTDSNLDDFFYHTEGSYSFPKKFIEIMYCQPIKSTTTNSDINSLGCLFSLKHNLIYGHMIIIGNSYDLHAEKFVKIDSVLKKDILSVIRRRFFFTAILIKETEIIKYYYQNPAYLISKIYNLSESSCIEKLSINFLQYNLLFYFQNSNKTYLNKIATRINGLYQFHGDVLVLNELEENIFTNISLHEFKRLNILAYGRLYDRKLKEDENFDFPLVPEIIDVPDTPNSTTNLQNLTNPQNPQVVQKKPMWSKYIIIQNRMTKLNNNNAKNQCMNCFNLIKNLVLCEKCCRMKYCSKECLKNNDSLHYDDCINPKSF